MANSARGSGRAFSLLDNEDPLEDNSDSQFRGATLSITPENERSPSPAIGDANITTTPAVPTADRNANLKNEQPQIMSSTTKYHQTANTVRTDNSEEGRNYFASGAFENAVENCRPIILENIDGQFQGAWLLTEIDHWDNEKERLVFLLDRSLVIIKYDFITLRILDYRRILLQDLDQVSHGKVTYPHNSLMPKFTGAVGQVKGFVSSRFQRTNSSTQSPQNSQSTGLESRPKNAIGVRAMWNKGRPLEFSKNWNPWSREIPFITLTAHRLHYNENSAGDSKNYNIDDFKQRLLQCIQTLSESQHCLIKEEPIIIENYVGLVAAVHNITDLGFFKARGRVSF